jgi:DNA-binding XRE family transcriptional regulator
MPDLAPLVLERMKAGMTQEMVGIRIGVSAPTISNLEGGIKHTSMATLIAYAALFGLKPKMVFVPLGDNDHQPMVYDQDN